MIAARKHAGEVTIKEAGLFGDVVSAPAMERAAAMVTAYYGCSAGEAMEAMRPYVDQCDQGEITPFEAIAYFMADAVANAS